MSRTSYTASERRGILAIAVIALLIIGFGTIFSFCNNRLEAENEELKVIEHPEMIDSIAVKHKKDNSLKTRSKKKNKAGSNKTKTKKTYRQRSPLDEPV